MANYYASSRSNYFAVKDAQAFEDEMSNISDIEVITKTGEDGILRYGVLSHISDSGGWPSWVFNEETDDYDDIDFFDIVSEHLADNEVAIFMEAGAEKLRYICGYAVAVNNKGETRQISLNNIYDLAKEIGTNVTIAEY